MAVQHPEALLHPGLLRLAGLRVRLRAQAAPAASVLVQTLETEDQLWDYVWLTWGIQIPRLAVCPGHVAPFTAFADAYFARDSMIVWEGSRGFAGKSKLLSLLGLTIATTRGGSVNILGGSGEQSRRVLDYMGIAWEAPHAPRHLLQSDPHAWRQRLAGGAMIQALTASSTSVRGPHIPTLLLDECDEFSLPLFDAAMGQTMAEPGRPAVTVMSSTHQYPTGTFTEIKRRAKEQSWLYREWCVDGNAAIMGLYGNIKMSSIDIGDPIYAVVNGHQVLTYVTDHWCSGEQSTVIVSAGGCELCCTATHRFLTRTGWKRAGALQPGDSVYTVSDTAHYFNEARLYFASMERSKDASLGDTIVTSIRRGPTIPVYDLTVAHGTSFIANSFVVHNCYRESLAPHGWLAVEEVTRKRREVTAVMWQTEYELQEPSSEGRAIDPAAVAAMFQRERGEYAGEAREYVESESPHTQGFYWHGADWAKEQDWTEIVTLAGDVPPYRLIAYERMQHLPWPQMTARFDSRIARFAVASRDHMKALHDNTGLGDVIADNLTQDAEGMNLVGRGRADLFSECINAIEKGEIVAPFIAALEAQIRYCTVSDLYGSGHPPDGFVALALAYRATKMRPKPLRGGPRAVLRE